MWPELPLHSASGVFCSKSKKLYSYSVYHLKDSNIKKLKYTNYFDKNENRINLDSIDKKEVLNLNKIRKKHVKSNKLIKEFSWKQLIKF